MQNKTDVQYKFFTRTSSNIIKTETFILKQILTRRLNKMMFTFHFNAGLKSVKCDFSEFLIQILFPSDEPSIKIKELIMTTF